MKPLHALISKSNIKNANSKDSRMLAICPYYDDEDKCQSMGLKRILDYSNYNWYILTIKNLRKIEFIERDTCVIRYGYTINEIIDYIETHSNKELVDISLSKKEIEDLCR